MDYGQYLKSIATVEYDDDISARAKQLHLTRHMPKWLDELRAIWRRILELQTDQNALLYVLQSDGNLEYIRPALEELDVEIRAEQAQFARLQAAIATEHRLLKPVSEREKAA